jgi:hypothetical protein
MNIVSAEGGTSQIRAHKYMFTLALHHEVLAGMAVLTAL